MVRGNLGVALYEKGEMEEALYNLNKAIQLKPDNAILYDNRGGVYAELGQYQYAFDDFIKAINLKPDYSGSYMQRCCLQ